MTGRACEECGGSMVGRTERARFCGRECQLRALYRVRYGTAITVTIDLPEESRRLLDAEAAAADLTTRQYVERLIEGHLDVLLSLEGAAT